MDATKKVAADDIDPPAEGFIQAAQPIEKCLPCVELEVKEKAEALRALIEGSFKRRNELEALEWKMNFSLWTGIVIAAWALHNKPETQHLRWWSLSFLLVFVIQGYYVYRFATGEYNAVTFALKYLDQLETLVGIADADKPSRATRTKLIQWYLLEVGPTILLVAAAVALVW